MKTLPSSATLAICFAIIQLMNITYSYSSLCTITCSRLGASSWKGQRMIQTTSEQASLMSKMISLAQAILALQALCEPSSKPVRLKPEALRADT